MKLNRNAKISCIKDFYFNFNFHFSFCSFSFLLLLLTAYFFVILNPSFCYGILQPKVGNLSQENLSFVGREEQLEKIHSFFKGKRRILALTGGPGFGKTQIAKKYAQQFYKNSIYHHQRWWYDNVKRSKRLLFLP